MGVSIWNIFLFFSVTLLQGNRVGFHVKGIGPSAYKNNTNAEKNEETYFFRTGIRKDDPFFERLKTAHIIVSVVRITGLDLRYSILFLEL